MRFSKIKLLETVLIALTSLSLRQLEVDVDSIRFAICSTRKLKLKPQVQMTCEYVCKHSR